MFSIINFFSAANSAFIIFRFLFGLTLLLCSCCCCVCMSFRVLLIFNKVARSRRPEVVVTLKRIIYLLSHLDYYQFEALTLSVVTLHSL